MSMNIHFDMVRNEIRIFQLPSKNGKKGKTVRKNVQDIIRLPVWQTPTEVTKQILESIDPVQTYFDWVHTQSNIVYEPQYAPDDLFGDNEPIGYIPVDYANEHIRHFTNLMNQYKDEGYSINGYMM